MATYAIGDVQGCFSALQALLAKINFDASKDTLWCAGDLVNRGPQSLEALRYFKSLGDKHKLVLGNHDLHLIAVVYGVRQQLATDSIQSILDAPDCDELIAWLCQQPLLVVDKARGFAMSHAGLAPMWTLDQAMQIASEVETALKSDSRELLLKNMFGNLPDYWRDDLSGIERLRCAINYFTRMRFCYPDGRLNLTYKGDLAHKPEEIIPWFNVVPRAHEEIKIIFGHWAALNGKANVSNVCPLDTGCVWGNCLTAMRLEDQVRFSVKCASQAG